MKKFPHLVQMHKKLQDQGLVILSLTTDEVDDKDKVLAFLKKQEASFANYLLKDTEANAKKHEEKYPVEPQPMLWLFNRKGEQVLKDDGKLKEEEIDKKVAELLKN